MSLSIVIDPRITDDAFMEYCLNLYFSGYDPSLIIGFYALGKGWNINKVIFLNNEMKGGLIK